MGKNPFKSKTLWLNMAAMAVAAGSGGIGLPMTLIPGVSDAVGYVNAHPHVALGLLAGGNMVLRALTKGPISLLEPFQQ